MRANSLLRRSLIDLGTAAFWIGLWYGVAVAVDQVILIPTPWLVLQTLGKLVLTPLFWRSVGLSLLRVCTGFAVALAVGSLFAVLTARYAALRVLLSPVLHIVRAAPVASFIIITLVWIRYQWVPVFISFLMVLPIVWINVEQGIRETDPQLLEMASLYRLSFSKRFWKIYVPSVKPFFLTAAVNGLGFAWKSGVAAEVICRPDFSIGKQLQDAKVYFETPEVFAWTAVVVLLSLLLERLLLRVTASASTRKEKTSHANI